MPFWLQALFCRRSELPLRRCWLLAAQTAYEEPDPVPTPDDPAHAPGDAAEDAADGGATDRASAAHNAALWRFMRATGLRFARFGLLRQAFTHPSFAASPRDRATTSSGSSGSGFRSGSGDVCSGGGGGQPSVSGLPSAASAQSSRPPARPQDTSGWHAADQPARPPCHSNRRLEFLGDAVLQVVASDYLYRELTDEPDASLGALRITLVNNTILCDAAIACGMHLCMRHGRAGPDENMDAPGRARRGMLADAFEAFLGALFLDRQPLGLPFAKAFARDVLFTLKPQLLSEGGSRYASCADARARLQLCLSEFNAHHRLSSSQALTATFAILDERGLSHERTYLVGCSVGGQLVAQARAQSFIDGCTAAALRAQEALGLLDEGSWSGAGRSDGDGATDGAQL